MVAERRDDLVGDRLGCPLREHPRARDGASAQSPTVRVVRANHRSQSNTPESPMPLPPDAHLNSSCACSCERLVPRRRSVAGVLGDRLCEDIVRVVQHDGPADVVVDRPALLSGQEHDERHQASEGD